MTAAARKDVLVESERLRRYTGMDRRSCIARCEKDIAMVLPPLSHVAHEQPESSLARSHPLEGEK